MKKVFSLVTGLFFVFATAAHAQRFKIEPKRPSITASHDVEIVNQVGVSIRLKLMGYQEGAQFVIDLRPGQRVKQRLFAGERVLCVWDQKQQLRIAGSVDVSRAGRLVLRAPQNQPQRPKGSATPMAAPSPLPKLVIE